MTQWIITSSVLIVIIAVLRFVLRGKISLKLQYALWGLVLIRLMLPFSVFESPASVLNFMQEREETFEPPVYYEPYAPGTINPGVPDDDIYILDGYVEQIAPETNITIDKEGFVTEPEIRVVDWGDVLMGVWLAGTAVFGAVFAVSNLRFRKKLKNTREYVNGTKAWLPVYESSAVKTPCLFGAIKPAIYVTKEVLADEKVLSHVLEHETTHYRHGDHVWSVLRCFCLALHWYNPLVWLAAFLSMRDSELACDEDTIKRIGEEERIGYGRTLINLTCEKPAVGILSAATTMTGSKSSIKERIMLIAKKPKMLKITAAVVAVIAVFAVGCTFTGAVVYNPKNADVEVTESFSNRLEPELTGLNGVIRMTVTSASPEEITTEIYNKSSEEIRYSTGYALHFEKDGKWYELDNIEETTDMVFFKSQSRVLKAESESSWTNVSKESFGKLPDGKYRIIRTVSFGEMDISENEFYVLAAEFTVSEPKGFFGMFSKEYSKFFPGPVGTEFLNGEKTISDMEVFAANVDSPVWNVSMKLSEDENKTLDEILDGYNFWYYKKGEKEEDGRWLYGIDNPAIGHVQGTDVFYLGLGKNMVSPGISTIKVYENAVYVSIDIVSCKNPEDFSDETFDFGIDYIFFVSREKELVEKLVAFCNMKVNVDEFSYLYPAKLEKSYYIPTEQIFMNFASSFFGIPDERYRITDDTFVILDSETNEEIESYPVSEWKWQEFPYSAEEWKNLFIVTETIPFPDISEYRSRYYQPLDEYNFIASLDGELWLVNISPKRPSVQNDLWVWDIYRIAPAEEPVLEEEAVTWNHSLTFSSAIPYFEFAFDFDFSMVGAEVYATNGEGALIDVDNSDFETANTVVIKEKNYIRWVPYSDDIPALDRKGRINFEVFLDENDNSPAYIGSINIHSTGYRDGLTFYEATLVSEDLALRYNDETGGGIIIIKPEIVQFPETEAMTDEEFFAAAKEMGYNDEQLETIGYLLEEGLTKSHVLHPLTTSVSVSLPETTADGKHSFGTFFFDPDVFADYGGPIGFAYILENKVMKIIPEIPYQTSDYGIIDDKHYIFAGGSSVRFYEFKNPEKPSAVWEVPEQENTEFGYWVLDVAVQQNVEKAFVCYVDMPDDFDKVYNHRTPDLSSTYQIAVLDSKGKLIRNIDTGINLMVEFSGLPDCIRPEIITASEKSVLFKINNVHYTVDYTAERSKAKQYIFTENDVVQYSNIDFKSDFAKSAIEAVQDYITENYSANDEIESFNIVIAEIDENATTDEINLTGGTLKGRYDPEDYLNRFLVIRTIVDVQYVDKEEYDSMDEDVGYDGRREYKYYLLYDPENKYDRGRMLGNTGWKLIDGSNASFNGPEFDDYRFYIYFEEGKIE